MSEMHIGDKMRVGIVTFIDYKNHGNRLQNYAVQELLKPYCDEVETVLTEKYNEYKGDAIPLSRKIKHIIMVLYGIVFDMINRDPRKVKYIHKCDRLDTERIKKNQEFTDIYIKETDFMMREGILHRKKMRKYDYVFTGSDQVWNPRMSAGNEMFYLQNVERGKRMAICASFGIEQIPVNMLRQTKKYIDGMDYISVREQSGADIINVIANKESIVLLDPTMLISESVWDKMADNAEIDKEEKYIVTYVLGELTEEDESGLKRCAEKIGVNKIIRLNDKSFEAYYAINAAQFIAYIRDAELVITDSFHACVFSILFNKIFLTIRRRGMHNQIYTRIENLLAVFGYKDRELTKVLTDSELLEEIKDDRREINIQILKAERKKANEFLRKCFSN